MKYTFIMFIGLTGLTLITGCKDNNSSRYVDPDSGRTLTLVKDSSTGLMVDEETKKPLYIYVDTEKKDTILGASGKVINGKVVKEDGKYKYTEYSVETVNGPYKIKDGDYKEKVDKDGDIKIKDGDKTIKVDGKTGEMKVK